jgi:hypothetical protein
MSGVLKAKVGGVWVPIIGSGMTAEVARWNSAWGIVGTGSFTFSDGAVLTVGAALTNTLSVATVANRRYRIVLTMRALGHTTNQSNSVTVVIDGVDYFERWLQALGNVGFTQVNTEWLWTGAAGTHSFYIKWGGAAGAAGYSNGGSFYIEDMGPTIYNAAPPPVNAPGPWTAVTLLNGFVNLGSPRPPSTVRKTGDVVELRIAVKSGTVNGNICSVPAGYGAPYTMDFYGRDGGGPGLFNLNQDGTVSWYGSQANNTLVALHCSYSTTA